MNSIEFSENKVFYKKLDAAIKNGERVSVKFNREKIAKKSKLIPRLKKCANWNEIKKEFEKLESNKQSPISGFLSPELKAKAVDGRLLILIGVIATLIVSLSAYAIYKGYIVRITTKYKKGETEVEQEMVFKPA